LREEKIETAFENSLGIVAGEDNDCHICCCFHDHKPGCLWVLYESKYGKDKAHELHTANCMCFKYSKGD